MRTVSHPTDLRVIDSADPADLAHCPELGTPLDPSPPAHAGGPFLVDCPACWYPEGAPVEDEAAAVDLAGQHDDAAHGGQPTAQVFPTSPPPWLRIEVRRATGTRWYLADTFNTTDRALIARHTSDLNHVFRQQGLVFRYVAADRAVTAYAPGDITRRYDQ